jgi:hypothetical protein
MFENKVPRKIFGQEEMREWGELKMRDFGLNFELE